MVSQEELLQAARDYGLDAVTAEVVVAGISRQADLFAFDLLRSYVRETTKSKEVSYP